MSVINKMLQDLDQRRGRPGGEAGVEPGVGHAVRSVVPASASGRRQTVLLVILGVVVLAVAAGWWLQKRNAVMEASKVVVPDRAAAVTLPKIAPPVAAPAPAAAPVEPAVAAASATPAAPVPPAPPVAAATPKPAVTAAAMPVAPPRAAASATPATGSALVAAVGRPVPSTAPSTAPAAAAPAEASPKPDKVDTPPTPPRLTAASTSTRPGDGKSYTPEQLSANLLSEAIKLDQQGHPEEAKLPLQKLLAANPLHVRARQMLAQLQLDTGRVDQARSLLAEGQRLLPDQSNFTMTLARLQVDGGDVGGAIRLLEGDRSTARNDPQFNAFLGALLLRVERYDEAVQRYLVALRSDPANASWLVGVGVALEGVGKQADAAEAYRRAEGSANLSPEMADFLSERLARLRR